MQKQKTLAKWLAIILLCTVAVGSYVLYDALYLKKTENQATAENQNINKDVNGDTDSTVEEYVPYYTILPRQAENIDGVFVSHFGGENDDVLHDIINYKSKRYAIFTSNSVEFDMRERGLSLAIIGEGVEKVVCLDKSATYIDGKMSRNGVAILTKNDSECALIFVGDSGDMTAKVSLPYFTEGKLYISGQNLLLFSLSNGYLYCTKILDNLTVQQCPFVLKTSSANIIEIFDSQDGQTLICGNKNNSLICTFNQNKGFNVVFQDDKLSFEQIITAGTASDCNYILYGKLGGEPWLYSFDTAFNLVMSKSVDHVNDGVLLPHQDGFAFIGDGLTKSYCKHLDEVYVANNDFDFETVLALTYGNGSVFAIVEDEIHLKKLLYASGDIAFEREFDFDGDIVKLTSNSNGFSIHLTSPSSTGLFRANFGKTDCFVIDVDLPRLYESNSSQS